MKKILLPLLMISQIGILSAQKTQSNLIIGTWRFEKEYDFRTEKEKSNPTFENVKITIDYVETENGTHHPDKTFKNDGKYIGYFNREHIDYGKWEIQNDTLIIWTEISEEHYKGDLNRINSFGKTIRDRYGNNPAYKEKFKSLYNIYRQQKKHLIQRKFDNKYYSEPLILEIDIQNENYFNICKGEGHTVFKRLK